MAKLSEEADSADKESPDQEDAGQSLLLQVPGENAPKVVSAEEFHALWSGELVLITKRSILPGMSGKFDISWFIPSILKYKKILGQVLIAFFFIQLFELMHGRVNH